MSPWSSVCCTPWSRSTTPWSRLSVGHLREAESVGPGIGGGEVGEAGGQEQGWGEEKEEKRNLSRTSWFGFGNYLNVQGGTESMLKG